MPLESITSRFAIDNIYLHELSDDALPREFYRMPAHKHYHDWSYQFLGDVCGNPERMLSLYKRIEKEDWCDVRINPEQLGHGWLKQCTPKHEGACKPRTAGSASSHEPDPGQPVPGESDERVTPMSGFVGQFLILGIASFAAFFYVITNRKPP